MKRLLLVLTLATALSLACIPGAAVAETRTPPAAPSGGITPAFAADDIGTAVALPASPFSQTLEDIDNYDVYFFNLSAGQEITFVMQEPPGATDFDLMLWGPGATNVADPPLKYLDTGHYPEALSLTASSTGTYYLGVFNYQHATDDYTVSYSVVSASASDNIPGVPLPASPVVGNVDADDLDDVYKVFMRAGDSFTFTLNDPDANDIEWAYDLYLFGPNDDDVMTDTPLTQTSAIAAPESLSWTAGVTGWYYLDVYNVGEDHAYTIEWSAVLTPLKEVWRFYIPSKGTHFYSADAAEVANVKATLPAYTYEGPCYILNPAGNSAPLYRFYNVRTGTHLYTADEAEKAIILATLGATYQYDGIAYYVMRVPIPHASTVWRFYNSRSGTHFYTADPAEKAYIEANLGATYQLEGPAFYLGQ